MITNNTNLTQDEFRFPKPDGNTDAERNAIAYCLNGGFQMVRDSINADFFTNAQYKAIFETMEHVADSGNSVDAEVVANALEGKINGTPSERLKFLLYIPRDGMLPDDGPIAVQVLRECTYLKQLEDLINIAILSGKGKLEPDKAISEIIEKANRIQADLGTEKMEGLLDLSTEIPEPVALVERGEDEVLHLGDIQMIDGKSKSGKSSVCVAIAAAVLGGEPDNCLGFSGTLDGAKVFWVDTEMNPRNTAVTARRVLRAAGMPTNHNNPRLTVVSWRGKPPKEQEKLLFRNARRLRPQLIVLDGITDIIGDFNDLNASTDIISRLMALSLELNCAILSVIHVNPGGKGAEQKATGNLGSILLKKVSIEIQITAENDEKNARREVRFLKARNGSPEHFWFTIDENGTHLCSPTPNAIGNKVKIRNRIEKVLNEHETITHTDLCDRLIAEVKKTDGVTRNKRTAINWINTAINDGGYLKKNSTGQYYRIEDIYSQTEISSSDEECDDLPL